LDKIYLTQDSTFTPTDSDTLKSIIRKGIIKTWYENRAERLKPATVAIEKEGNLVMEFESIPSTKGWLYKADSNRRHSGFGYLEWTQKGQGIKAGEGILSYPIRIEKAGNYQLFLRSKMRDPKNRMETPDPDGNDVWVKCDNSQNVPNQQPLNNGWQKIAILGHPEGYTWNTNADKGPPHPATPACFRFEKGDYLLQFSGRSEGHAIDKIMLRFFENNPMPTLTKEQEAVLDKMEVSRKVF
jgi:hypothetical protein